MNILKESYLKAVGRYAKSDTQIPKGLKKRIQNHTLHVQFERKISVSQSNLLYPKYGVYVYSDLKQQKMPKCVKMITSKWHRKQEHFFIHSIRSFQCIWFVRLSRNNFLCRKQWGKGGGRNFRLCPLLSPQGNLTGPNWHIAHLDHVSYKIRL